MPASSRSRSSKRAGVHVYGKRSGLSGGAGGSGRGIPRGRPAAKPAPGKQKSNKKDEEDADESSTSDSSSSDEEVPTRKVKVKRPESKGLFSDFFSNCHKTTLGELPDIGDYYFGVLENAQQKFVRDRIRHFVLGVCGSTSAAASSGDDDDGLSRSSFNLSAAFRGGVSVSAAQSSAQKRDRNTEAASSAFTRSTSAPGTVESFASRPATTSGPGTSTTDSFTRCVSAPGESQTRRITERDWDDMGKRLGTRWLEVWKEIQTLRHHHPALAKDLMSAIAKYYGDLLARKFPSYLAKKLFQPGFEPDSDPACTWLAGLFNDNERILQRTSSNIIDLFCSDRETFMEQEFENFADLLPDLGRYYYVELESPQQKKVQEHFREFRASLDKCAMFMKASAESAPAVVNAAKKLFKNISTVSFQEPLKTDKLARKHEAADGLAAKWLLDAISRLRAVFMYSKKHQQQVMHVITFFASTCVPDILASAHVFMFSVDTLFVHGCPRVCMLVYVRVSAGSETRPKAHVCMCVCSGLTSGRSDTKTSRIVLRCTSCCAKSKHTT